MKHWRRGCWPQLVTQPPILLLLLLWASCCCLWSVAVADECHVMTPAARPARKNPGRYLSNGTVDARVCRYECSRIRPPPSYAFIADNICLCSSSTNTSALVSTSNCALACPVTAAAKCGNSASQVLFSGYNITVPVSGLRFLATPKICDGSVNVTADWTLGQATISYVIVDPFSAIRHSGYWTNGLWSNFYLHNCGPTAQLMSAKDSEDNADSSSFRVNVIQRLKQLEVTIASFQAYGKPFDLLLTIRRGSNATAVVNFGNGHSVSVAYIPPAEAVYSGPLTQPTGATSAAAAGNLYFMVGSVFKYNSTLTGFRVNAAIPSAFILQIWRPTCPAGQRYCYQPNACVSQHVPCSSAKSSRTKTCTGGRFSLTSRQCANANGTAATVEAPPAAFDQPHYTFLREVTVNVPGCLSCELPEPDWLTVEPGDVPAIVPQSSGIHREVTGTEGFVEYSVSTASVSSYGSRLTAGTNVTIATSATSMESQAHRIGLLSFRTSTVLVPFTYANHSCPSTPPQCQQPVRFNVTVTASNYWNTSQPIVDTRSVEVQVAVANLSIVSDAAHPTHWLRNFSIPAHAGSLPHYCWDFADGSAPVCTGDSLQVQHKFTRPGVFNVTVTCSNNVSVEVAFVSGSAVGG